MKAKITVEYSNGAKIVFEADSVETSRKTGVTKHAGKLLPKSNVIVITGTKKC